MALGLGPVAVGANDALQELLARRFAQQMAQQEFALKQQHETGLESDRQLLRRQQEEAIRSAGEERAARTAGLTQAQATKDREEAAYQAYIADPNTPELYKQLARAKHEAGVTIPGEALKGPDLVPIQGPTGPQYGPKVAGAVPANNPDESFEAFKRRRDYEIAHPIPVQRDPLAEELAQGRIADQKYQAEHRKPVTTLTPEQESAFRTIYARKVKENTPWGAFLGRTIDEATNQRLLKEAYDEALQVGAPDARITDLVNKLQGR